MTTSDDVPDVLHFWPHTWTKRGDVWEGPPVSDPAEYLPLALACGRIEVQGECYVIVDPWQAGLARQGGITEAELGQLELQALGYVRHGGVPHGGLQS